MFFAGDLPDWLGQVETFGIFAVGYFARPLGGIVMAHFSDVRGRKRIFTLSVFLMAIPTLLIELLATYRSVGIAAPLLLFRMRVMQGIAIGGEAPGAWVFVAEHARRGNVGLAVGLLTTLLSSGIFLGSMVAVFTNSAFNPCRDHCRKLAFAVPAAGIFRFIAMLLRRWLASGNTSVQGNAQAAATARNCPSMPSYGTPRQQSLVALSTWMLTASIVLVILISPSLLENLFHIAPRSTSRSNTAS